VSIAPEFSATFVLASASPRRRQLLAAAGYRFSVDPSHIEEPEPLGPCDVRLYVSELAYRKAWNVGQRHPEDLVLAADTACAIDGQILNKPVDRQDAERMIRLQEGRPIEVVTGVILLRFDVSQWVGAVESSVVLVRPLSDAERIAYLDSGLWEGKAGGYGVQDDDPFVSIISGSFSNVVGLPMERLAELLEQHPLLR
jgi:septum formation protein